MTIQERAEAINALLITFKSQGISHEPKKGLDAVLRFQDLIGQATMPELCEIESAFAEEQRRIFVWVCFSALGYDGAMNVFKGTVARRKITQWYEEEVKQLRIDQAAADEKWNEAARKENSSSTTLAMAQKICDDADTRHVNEMKAKISQHLTEVSKLQREIELHKEEIEVLIRQGETQMAMCSRLRVENSDLQAVKRVMQQLMNKGTGIVSENAPDLM